MEKENRNLSISDPSYKDQGFTQKRIGQGGSQGINAIDQKNMSCFCCG